MNIGHLEGLPQAYSVGDLYRITMVINPPTNWELILQALMLPFFMNRQKYTDKTQMLKMDKSEGGVKKMAFWVVFFLMLPARVSCKKNGATILPEKHRNKCFFV